MTDFRSTTRVTTKPPQELALQLQEELEKANVSKVDPDQAIKEEESRLDGDKLLELQRKVVELELAKAQLQKFQDDNKGRREFSNQIFTVVVIWMFLVLMVLIQCAMKKWELPEAVLIALITTTSANVLGLFIIVASYLFNKDKST